MCHLVTWFNVPKSDAERNTMQSAEFFDDPQVQEEGDKSPFREGLTKAMEKAEQLIREGAKEVKLWKLIGRPTARTVIDWEQPQQKGSTK